MRASDLENFVDVFQFLKEYQERMRRCIRLPMDGEPLRVEGLMIAENKPKVLMRFSLQNAPK